MKNYHILAALLFLIATSSDIEAQKKEFHIVLSCTEYIGEGKLRAHFGYENPGNKILVVDENGSVVSYNQGQSKKYGLNTFAPGVNERAFYIDFDAKDRVEWTVTLSNGKTKSVDANIHSNHCKDIPEGLDIIPGYHPPEGGKEYNSKIGAELTSLYKAYEYDPENFQGASDAIFQLDASKVLIEVVSEPGVYSDLMSSLDGTGFEAVTEDPGLNRATGWIDIAMLLHLNTFSALDYARPVYPGVSNYSVPATGLTNSQGDFAMHSDFARLGFDVDGDGVKIGVLSNSYNSKQKADVDVSNGDLPGAQNPNAYLKEVQVLKDLTQNYGSHSDEGRAMLQIIHDIAPGAELAFRTGYLGEQDMADGIRELADSGCHIIVDDLSYITEPFFRDGVISKAIDEVVADGHTFFSSAGNFGRYAYSAQFSPATAPSTISGEAHAFGPGDIFQGISLQEGDYMLVLQWDDGSDPDQATTLTDLDIFLSDDVGFSLLGFNRENIGGFPIEVVPFSVAGDSVVSNILITRAAGPDVTVDFKYMLFRGGSLFRMLEHEQGNSTIVGHPNAQGTIAVGAVRYDKNPVYSPGQYEKPVIMSFSSVGGTPVNGVIRSKPDISAPNGTNTTVDLGNGDWAGDSDAYPNFFGTSAASPHAAGVAALILEASKKFEPGSSLTPEDMRILMKNTAIDMETPGEDLVSGAGFIQAHKALMSFANPSPYVENLILISEGGVPGEALTPVSFTLNGDFFTDQTQVLFRGEVLDSGVVVEDENTILVEHPGFLGNPEIQAYTPAISSSGEDGGTSSSSYFSDPVKQRIVVSVNPAAKKFGEVLPQFSANAELINSDGDTLSLDDALSSGQILQQEFDRITSLDFLVAADDTSDAGEYLVQAVLNPPMAADSLRSELDIAISEKYRLDFVNSSLMIEKLSLKVTPNDLNLVYGDEIPEGGITFSYEIDDSLAFIEEPSLILSHVETEHTSALSNAVSLIRGVALVNGIPVVRGVALVNGVQMIRGVALVNGTEIRVDIVGADTTVFIDGEPVSNGISLSRGIALVNGLPFIQMTNMLRGIALVNGEELTIEEGYISELNGIVLENKVPVSRGVALVNGEALVNGHTVIASENGPATIDGEMVDPSGVSLVNGITLIRGVALVNSSHIIRGTALVNGLEIPLENGMPVLRGVALVNGIPLSRGIALVNNLEVEVIDGDVASVREDGALLNNISMVNGVGLVRGIALVNGSSLSRGIALVNGIALPDENGFSDDVVDLDDMNLMASGTVLANGSMPNLRGIALVNGLESIDGQSLKDAVVSVNTIIGPRGIALVNGLAYARGIALVNGLPVLNGSAQLNTSTINEQSNKGSILVFDATDLDQDADSAELSFEPISFITGTTAGQHWIVPGTFISNNFDISYGLGTLTIEKATVTLSADAKSKVYGHPDPELTFRASMLEGDDHWEGSLVRDSGENAGTYEILQGSMHAGDNYQISYRPDSLEITPAALHISSIVADKVYDGSREGTVLELGDNRLAGDELSITSGAVLFDSKNVGEAKQVVVSLELTGIDAGNYLANDTDTTYASIRPKDLLVSARVSGKVYDGSRDAIVAELSDDRIAGDELTITAGSALFDNKDVGDDKRVLITIEVTGSDAANYVSNTSAYDTASIFQREVLVQPSDPYLIIREGDLLPTMAFIYNGWVNGDYGNNGFTVTRENDGLPYDVHSSESAGTYVVTPTPVNANYSFVLESGLLHVNPSGPGTRAIRPVLNCVQELGEHLFVANFEYENRNDVAIHIPLGVDNQLGGSGIDWAASDQIPTVFAPGGGQFRVFFDGGELSWLVNSRDEYHKTSNSANASSSSTKCGKSFGKSASAPAGIEDGELEIPQGLRVYPNPASDRIFISLENLEDDIQMISLFDMTGKMHHVMTTFERPHLMEMDLTELKPGTYFIRIIMEEDVELVSVIRQ